MCLTSSTHALGDYCCLQFRPRLSTASASLDTFCIQYRWVWLVCRHRLGSCLSHISPSCIKDTAEFSKLIWSCLHRNKVASRGCCWLTPPPMASVRRLQSNRTAAWMHNHVYRNWKLYLGIGLCVSKEMPSETNTLGSLIMQSLKRHWRPAALVYCLLVLSSILCRTMLCVKPIRIDTKII